VWNTMTTSEWFKDACVLQGREWTGMVETYEVNVIRPFICCLSSQDFQICMRKGGRYSIFNINNQGGNRK
jgi:hypothetical protein